MKNVLLIEAGRFGRHIAMQLSQLGAPLLNRPHGDVVSYLYIDPREWGSQNWFNLPKWFSEPVE